MSRELEFRAWDKSGKRMLNKIGVHPTMLCLNDGYSPEQDGAFTISPEFSNYIIEQYTGLKDKNGVKIFESDILDEKFKVKVVFFHGGWHVKGKHVKHKPLYDWLLQRIKAGCPSAIIGNIHENPELLS